MGSFYLNSFHPLVSSPAGRAACAERGLLPFIDGSIRREPDFEHPQPVIMCLCRGDRFAPRLRPGDDVGYLTVLGPYGMKQRHQRLIAVLHVERLFDAHSEAADWFADRSLPLPNNLMVHGNPAYPLSHSHRKNPKIPNDGNDDRFHRRWDAAYSARATNNGRVVGCSVLFVDADWTAPMIPKGLLEDVFGKRPGTLNPGRQDQKLMARLLSRLGIAARPSSQRPPSTFEQ